MKTTVMAAAAFLLSAGAAAAAPAVAEAPINLHARPTVGSPVVGAVPAGATVDVRGCTHSWCRVVFGGEFGFAARRLLALAGGPAVVAAPGYVYDEPYYDSYDYGYDYGPGFGVFVGPGGRFHHRRWSGRTWQGGTWNGARTGTWQGGTTGTRSGAWQSNRSASFTTGRTGTSAIVRGGGTPGSVSPQVSAPTGMSAGASVGGGAAVSAPPAGGGAAGGAVIRR